MNRLNFSIIVYGIIGIAGLSGCVVEKADDGKTGSSADGGSGGGGDTGGLGGSGGEPGTGGSGGDGSQEVPEGPPGSVGNVCKAGAGCDGGLVCGAGGYCQPELSMLPSSIVQAVPTADSGKVPSSAPILLFADATYAAPEVKVEAFELTGTSDVTATTLLSKVTSGAGKDVYVLTSKVGFPLGASVKVTLSGSMEGTLVFDVDHASPAFATGELGFEGAAGAKSSCDAVNGGAFTALPTGWTGFGDVGVLEATGSLAPTEGSRLVGLTSGAAICGEALSGTSSLLVSGPIEMGAAKGIGFDYDFQSSEFDDYCNSAFDDTFLAVLSGPKGAVVKVVDSVNLVCAGGKHIAGQFPTMPDGGDAVYKETGTLPFSLSGDVGSPAVISFVLTDVGDAILSSVVGIDRLRLE